MKDGNNKRSYVIAEVGVNHNGSLDLALRLVEAASEAGADAIKFQTFKADANVSRNASKAPYQKRTTDSTESQLDMIRKLELDDEAHRTLILHCETRGVQFLSTPFDLKSLDLLVSKLNLPCLKLASGEITNALLLLNVGRTGRPVILSTGMSTLGDIETALGILAFGYTQPEERPSNDKFGKAYHTKEGQRALGKKVTLLQCTTEYPAPFEDVNLKAMKTLSNAFCLPVGLSDHTLGIAVPIAAAALGAAVIEKHLTMDRSLPGPDHSASLEPGDFAEMVRMIRQVEASMGSSRKYPGPSEIGNLPLTRKSIIATHDIEKGEPFTEENLGAKRPGTGISAIYYWDLLGKIAQRNYKQDEMIDP